MLQGLNALKTNLAMQQAAQQAQSQAVGANGFTAKKVKFYLHPIFDGTPKILTYWLFNIIQYADLVGITTEGDKVKLAVQWLD